MARCGLGREAAASGSHGGEETEMATSFVCACFSDCFSLNCFSWPSENLTFLCLGLWHCVVGGWEQRALEDSPHHGRFASDLSVRDFVA